MSFHHQKVDEPSKKGKDSPPPNIVVDCPPENLQLPTLTEKRQSRLFEEIDGIANAFAHFQIKQVEEEEGDLSDDSGENKQPKKHPSPPSSTPPSHLRAYVFLQEGPTTAAKSSRRRTAVLIDSEEEPSLRSAHGSAVNLAKLRRTQSSAFSDKRGSGDGAVRRLQSDASLLHRYKTVPVVAPPKQPSASTPSPALKHVPDRTAAKMAIPIADSTENRIMVRNERMGEGLRLLEERMKLREMHNPEIVLQKRWFELVCLALSFRMLRGKGLRKVVCIHQERAACRVLERLFVPLYRLYRRLKRRSAEAMIQRFVMRCVIRARSKRLVASVDLIRKFLETKLKYLRGVFTWYRVKVKKAQCIFRRMMQRRECQVELNSRKVRQYEKTAYWREAQKLLQQTAKSTSDPTKAAAFAAAAAACPQRAVPERLLRRLSRDMVAKHCRLYHREVMRRESLRLAHSSGSKNTGKTSPYPRQPCQAVDDPPTVSVSSSSGLHRFTAFTCSEPPTVNEAVHSSMAALQCTKPLTHRALFTEEECQEVLDEACFTTSALQSDAGWCLHLEARKQHSALLAHSQGFHSPATNSLSARSDSGKLAIG